MDKQSKIFIAGHRGLVGSALVRRLEGQAYRRLIVRGRAELDLTNFQAVGEFFQQEKPEYVFLAAAKVGGILANKTYPADFIYQNLQIQLNVIEHARRVGVKRLLFLGSSCIYPRECPQPIREEYLLSGPLEFTNRPYAVAKIAGIETCWSYNRQYGTQYLAAMPTNLYGPGDNYDLQNSHVIPALLRKVHEAKVHDRPEVIVWGTGAPRREFLFSDDLADACVHLMNLDDERYFEALHGIGENQPPLINIGCGDDLTIRELAETICRVVGYSGRIVWDTSKPDGTPRKVLDTRRLTELGWTPRVRLEEGLKLAYANFLGK